MKQWTSSLVLIAQLAVSALVPAAMALPDDPAAPGPLQVEPRERSTMSPERLKAALIWARRKVAGYDELEKAMRGSERRLPSYYHSRHRADPSSAHLAREALVWVEAARAPANLSAVADPPCNTSCPALNAPTCDFSTRFRRQDGACNNRANPLWGASDTPAVRLAANTFDDGVHAVRSTSVNGSPLTGARRISVTVTGDSDDANEELALSVVNWGQFMDHDMTLSPLFLAQPGVELQCCSNGQVITDNAHPQCLPIEIAADDPFYGSRGQRCMEFARTQLAMPADCQVGPAITKNVLTSYIDGSGIYGSHDSRINLLRSGADGMLGTQGDNLLPPDPAGVQIDTETLCLSEDQNARPCLLGGDVRVNEQSGLTTMHTIWLREHNRIARELKTLQPSWNDEQLFQEARKIVGAEIQHITYNEWLPIVLGRRYTRKIKINIQRHGVVRYSRRYSPLANPSIATEFSTAAFRFGHSLIQGQLQLYENLATPPPASCLSVNLRDVFFNPKLIYQGRLDQFAIGMLTQHPQKFDANFAEDLSEFLFQRDGQNFGLDLIALNIQRGRDHGIATYTTMRAHCGLRRVDTFEQLETYIPESVVHRLQQVYAHVDDIDLFIGGVSERPAPGAIVGPTLRCIIGDQFFRLRWGDNMFYDLGGSRRPWRFSIAQLTEIKKVTWARILCDNIASITRVQRKAFKSPGHRNRIRRCRRIRQMNLSAWH